MPNLCGPLAPDLTVGIYAQRRQHLAACLARLGTTVNFYSETTMLRFANTVWPGTITAAPDLRDHLGMDQAAYMFVFLDGCATVPELINNTVIADRLLRSLNPRSTKGAY